jgi:hypothetical protein
MKENEINKILEHFDKHLDGSVNKAIEKYVNGHLREMKSHLERQDEKMEIMDNKIDALKVETAPIIESKRALVALRNFIVWIAAPIAILCSVYQFLTK